RTRADEEEQRQAEDAVRQLRKEVDFLAVSLHTGFGAGALLAEYEQPLSRALLDAGADVILGNHVHAIHGVEVYKGKAILYSPGNFIAQQPREGAPAIAIQIYNEMSPDGYVAILDVEDGAYQLRLVPTATNADGLPEVMHGAGFERIAERLKRLSAQLDTELEVRGEEVIVPVSSRTATPA